MSHPSLKEQLKALSLGLSSEKEQKQKQQLTPKDKIKPSKAVNTNAKAASNKPTWLEQAQYGVELLKVYFPNCFKELKEVKPLKIGIKQDLVKNLGAREDIVIGDKACMVNSLAYYVNSPAYHKSVIEGASRIDLNGEVSSKVTAEEAHYSIEFRKSKFQKKQASQGQTKHPLPSDSEKQVE